MKRASLAIPLLAILLVLSLPSNLLATENKLPEIKIGLQQGLEDTGVRLEVNRFTFSLPIQKKIQRYALGIRADLSKHLHIQNELIFNKFKPSGIRIGPGIDTGASIYAVSVDLLMVNPDWRKGFKLKLQPRISLMLKF